MTETTEDPPAGSLEFRNDDTVPHEITLEVLNVGTSIGERTDGHHTVTDTPDVAVTQRDLTATAVLEPGQTRTYESVFQSRVWYDVRFRLDDAYPGEDLARTVYNPARPSDETTGQVLVATVSRSGDFSWVVATTEKLEPTFQ